MVKQKTNKIIAVMLVLAVMLTSLIAGAMLLAPKTSEVAAAEAGSSATLLGNYSSSGNYTGKAWYKNLGSTGVTEDNIVNLTITTTASKIEGFTQGTNVKDTTSQNDLYYYYKANATDSTKYDVVIYADVETIYAPVNSYSLFSLYEHIDDTYVSNLKTITFENFNTSNVTDMSNMFRGCISLTSLDLSNFNTSNVTDMYYMFAACTSLTSLDVSNFNTSNVTDMNDMFAYCTSLTSLDVSNFNTSNVTDMNWMFYSCSSLTSLDVSGFDTNNVTSTGSMFSSCTSLTSLDLSGWDTSKVTNFYAMFLGCNLQVLDISTFTFESATDTTFMLGANDDLVVDTLESMGYSEVAEQYVLGTEEDKLNILKSILPAMFPDMSEEEIAHLAYCVLNTYFHTIYAPVTTNGQQILLPYTAETQYTYKIDGVEQAPTPILLGSADLGQTELVLYPQGDTPTILPPDVGEIDPDTPESGVTLVDLLILTMLTLTLSGVCVIILKNKNKSLNKR